MFAASRPVAFFRVVRKFWSALVLTPLWDTHAFIDGQFVYIAAGDFALASQLAVHAANAVHA